MDPRNVVRLDAQGPLRSGRRRLHCASALLLVLSSMVVACHASEPVIRVPQEPADALPVAAADDVDMDGATLARLASELPAPAEHGLRSALVMRRGRLVLEQYWNGYDQTAQQDLRSATKSITSLLVGIAIDQRVIEGVGEPLRSFLAPVYPTLPSLERNITLEHLLTMRSGLACNDRDQRSPGQEDAMYRERDWVRFFLELPSLGPPGGAAFYCTGGAVALGGVLARAAGRPVPEFADEFLFAPLGIRGARWASFDGGRQTDTGGHLALRPRDLLRLGQLVLQRGRWGDRQLVSSEWIDQSTSEHTRLDGGKPYGYLWWPTHLRHHGSEVSAVFAGGNGGQFLFVIPQLELVAVFTGGNYNSSKAQRPFKLLERYVVPAVR
jgi:CubicO group peptidase (beta-lactamase class C family)